MKVIEPFDNVPAPQLPEGTMYGSQVDNLETIQAGAGDTAFRVDKSGMWLGAEKFADAPFRVDMDGNVTMTSATISGYIVVGGAASDVNSHSTTVDGSKLSDGTITNVKITDRTIEAPKIKSGTLTSNEIAANTITATNIAANTITANEIASETITANEIASETITADQIASDGVHARNIEAGAIETDHIAANAVTANKISVSYLSAISSNIGTITAGTINASTVNVNNLNASNINNGTLSIGGSGKVSQIIISSSTNSGAYLRFGSSTGSRIWADSSKRIGINSLGSPMYIYVDSYQRIAIPSSGQTAIEDGADLKGNTNVRGDFRIDDGYKIKLYSNGDQYITSDSDDMKYYAYDNHEFYHAGDIKAIIDDNIWTDGNLYADGSKPFIIPHPDGSDRYLKYTAQESPDVVLRVRGRTKVGKVKLPKHFTLVTDPNGLVSVNLTPIGDHRVWVKSVDNKQLVIGGDKSKECFYEVMAIRSGYLNSPVEISETTDKELYLKRKAIQKRREIAKKEYIPRNKRKKKKTKG